MYLKKWRPFLAALLLVTAIIFSACSKNGSTASLKKTDLLLDTVVDIRLYGCDDESILEGAFDLCQYYEQKLSRTIESSEIAQLNQQGEAELSNDTIELLQSALYYSEITDGAFDVSIGAASSLWDFKSGNKILPDADQLQNAQKSIGYQDIIIKGNFVRLNKPGMQIDLGAIAKGFIADKIAAYFAKNDVPGAIINLGGDVLVIGEKPNKAAFNIGIQLPFAQRNELIGSVDIRQGAVISSGIYERGFELDGIYYHHILDPKTGYPASNEFSSVSIICQDAVEGEALSTACSVLGPEKGLALIESLTDVEAIFMLKNGEQINSSGIGSSVPFNAAK